MERSNLLETASSVLTYLGLIEYTCSVPWNEFVARITRACPQLESLTLSCPSEVFVNMQLPPRLRELWVMFRPVGFFLTSSWFAHLRELVTLRLNTVRPPSDSDVHEFILPLLRGLPQLQRLVWDDTGTCDDSELADIPLTYEMKQFISRAVLDGIEHGRDDFALCGDMAPTATLMALDSVVKYYSHGRTSAVGRLDKQLVILIGRFLGTRRPRDLWVTGERKGKCIRLPAQ